MDSATYVDVCPRPGSQTIDESRAPISVEDPPEYSAPLPRLQGLVWNEGLLLVVALSR